MSKKVQLEGNFGGSREDVYPATMAEIVYTQDGKNLEEKIKETNAQLSDVKLKQDNDKLFQVSIKDYDVPSSKDISEILEQINRDMPALGGKVYIPSDAIYIISKEIVFTKPIILFSDRTPYRHNLSNTTTFGIGTKDDGCLIFRGNGSAIESLNIVGLDGNTNDGVRFEAGRPILRNVSVIGHGKNGVVVGWDSNESPPINININGFYIENLTAKKNGGYGCVIADTSKTLADANIGTFSVCDIMNNKGGGMLIKKASMNVFTGLHIESNGGNGIRCESAYANTFVRPYVEASEVDDFYMDENCSKNLILGTRPGSNGVTTSNDDNFEVATTKNTNDVPFFSNFLTKAHSIFCASTGKWKNYVKSGRGLLFELTETSGTDGYIHFKHETDGSKVGFKLNDGTIIKYMTIYSKTINAGAIGANSTKDVSTALTGYTTATSVTVNPRTAIANGVTWCSYVNDDGEIIIRFLNTTSSTVNVSSAFAISILAL